MDAVVLLTIAEDIVTLGAGVADDPITIIPAQATKHAAKRAAIEAGKIEIRRRLRKKIRKAVFDLAA